MISSRNRRWTHSNWACSRGWHNRPFLFSESEEHNLYIIKNDMDVSTFVLQDCVTDWDNLTLSGHMWLLPPYWCLKAKRNSRNFTSSGGHVFFFFGGRGAGRGSVLVNARQRLSFSVFKNSTQGKNCQHLTNWTRRSKREELWSDVFVTVDVC